MAIKLPSLSTTLNAAVLIISLILVAVSTAVLYLTSHGMRLMDSAFPPGSYQWYRGPSWDMNTKHNVTLRYDSSNEGMIFAAGGVSCVAALVATVGYFMTRKTTSKTVSRTSILYLLILPGAISLLLTLIALVFTSVLYHTNHNGACYWENGYYPSYPFTCTRELAACTIGSYFVSTPWWALPRPCGDMQTGRRLVAPLFVASTLLVGVAIARYVLEGTRENEYVESPEERVERLQREERQGGE